MTRQKISEHEGAKYMRMISPCIDCDESGRVYRPIPVDVYEVLEAFPTGSPAIDHAVKKLITPGQRGKGDRLADLKGAMAALNRAIDREERRIKMAESDSAKSNGPPEGAKVGNLIVVISKSEKLPEIGSTITVNFFGNPFAVRVTHQDLDCHRVFAVPIAKPELKEAEIDEEAFLRA